ncbi:hypothetical protein UA08_09322 [Talaromyces atroroseus]|uniref:ARCA protein n=1 Tax=Talaromyces atroroseus TaxID=1441469 RepID=A0A1Q5Q6J5_TALAT|nr:hypothetical protein UA08_09322 [Talaromyces atroroseus]OKL55466.1 hypothetical protein UA08_09322 [Talaromyces atroroseus]
MIVTERNQYVVDVSKHSHPAFGACPKSASVTAQVPSMMPTLLRTNSGRLVQDLADHRSVVNYEYVDETADIASWYTTDSPYLSQNRRLSSESDQQPTSQSCTPDQGGPTDIGQASPQKGRHVCKEQKCDGKSLEVSSDNAYSVAPYSPICPRSNYSLPGLKEDTLQPSINNQPILSGSQFTLQEACLMRYFVTELAHWFDLCDSKRHFELTVPQRAMCSATLRNAIYTTSARHITRVKKYYVGDQIKYHNNVLSNLKPETALSYHNRCIEHLVSLSDDPMQVNDENLLAAAVILRFYEEVDVPFIDDDNENGLRGIRVFLHPEDISPTTDRSLRHAAYWIALRQEILTAFSKQRPFRLPLEPCKHYRTFDPADDYVWANRLVLHCADVLHYCFGAEKEMTNRDPMEYTPGILLAMERTDTPTKPSDTEPSDRLEKYDDLVAFETLWTEYGPSSFNPIYSREPDRFRGDIFPQYWYLNNCHVTGIQHLELARILLMAHNPRLPRLGLNHRIAMSSVDRDIKETVLRLCGMAVSNSHCPPTIVTAGVAIALCGDKFTERVEQEALLGILYKLDDEYGWPTQEIFKSLREAWGWIEEAC